MALFMDKISFAQIRILVGVFLLNFSGGLSSYYGNLNAYLESYFRFCLDQDRVDISPPWVGSVCMAVTPIGHFAAGFLKSKLGLRGAVFVGCISFSFGYLMSYYSTMYSVWTTALLFGVFGNGSLILVEILSFSFTSMWFPKMQGKAGSIVGVSSSSGGILYTYLITAFINPKNLKPVTMGNQMAYFAQTEILYRVPVVFLLLGSITFGTLFLGFFLMRSLDKGNPSSEGINIISGDNRNDDSRDDTVPNLFTEYTAFNSNNGDVPTSEREIIIHITDTSGYDRGTDDLNQTTLEYNTINSNAGITSSDQPIITDTDTLRHNGSIDNRNLNKSEYNAINSNGGIMNSDESACITYPHCYETIGNDSQNKSKAQGLPTMFFKLLSKLQALASFAIRKFSSKPQAFSSDDEDENNEASDINNDSDDSSTVIDKSPSQVIRTRDFYVISTSAISMSFSLFVVSSYYKFFAQAWIHEDSFLTLAGSFAAVTSVVIRFLIGVFIDRYSVKSVLIGILSTISICLLFWQLSARLHLMWLYFILTALLVSLCGIVFVLFPLMALKLFGCNHLAANTGLITMTMSIVDLCASPIATFILDNLGWFWLFAVTSTLNVLSLIVIALFMPITQLSVR